MCLVARLRPALSPRRSLSPRHPPRHFIQQPGQRMGGLRSAWSTTARGNPRRRWGSRCTPPTWRRRYEGTHSVISLQRSTLPQSHISGLAKEPDDDSNHNRVSAPPYTDLSRCSISLRSRRSEGRPYENGSPSRKIPGGNRSPLWTARASPSGELTSSVETENPYSAERRASSSLACVQNAQCSWVSRRTFMPLRRASLESLTNIGDEVGYRHIHGVLGSAAVIGPPFDEAIRPHQDKGMPIAAITHHAIAICAVGSGSHKLGI